MDTMPAMSSNERDDRCDPQRVSTARRRAFAAFHTLIAQHHEAAALWVLAASSRNATMTVVQFTATASAIARSVTNTDVDAVRWLFADAMTS
jgi:hypothetical protein